MRGFKKRGYTVLGWATWKVGGKVVKRKLNSARPVGKAKLAIPLLVVAVVGALIAARGSN